MRMNEMRVKRKRKGLHMMGQFGMVTALMALSLPIGAIPQKIFAHY
jgi:hypothetical protein